MKPVSTRHPAWRIAAVVLVLANIVYFAWSQGAFAAFGMQPSRLTQTEPHRMERQVRPTLLQVLKEAPPVPVPMPVPEAPPVAETPAVAAPAAESPAPASPADSIAR
ncbi:MAG: sporulation protein [Variovorax sp.]|nr:sporulation protein [Variovorax sp.]